MFALMKRLPTAVRQLAERHARAKGTVARLEAAIAKLQTQVDAARASQDAAGLVLTRLEERVQLDAIAGITARYRRFGKRGALRDAMLEVLRTSGTTWVSTVELGQAMQTRFQLEFISSAQRMTWVISLKSTLLRLVDNGVLERSRAGPGRYDGVLWRIKQEADASPLAQLRALAAQVAQSAEG